jgi:hypothetical protein
MNALSEDLLNEVPVYRICKQRNLSYQYVMKVVKALMNDEEYKNRCFRLRQAAGIETGKLHKKRWDSGEYSMADHFKRFPNKLE